MRSSRPAGPSTTRSAFGDEPGVGLGGSHRDPDEGLEPGSGEAAEGVEVGRVVAGIEAESRARVGDERANRGPLVLVDAGADLEHLASPARLEPGLLRAPRDQREALHGGLLIGRFAEVERQREALVLDGQIAVERRSEGRDRPRELGSARAQLETVVAHRPHAGNSDHRLGLRPGPAADAADEQVAVAKPRQHRPRLLGNGGELRPRRDRRERAVDVEEEGGPAGRPDERCQAGIGVHPP